MRPLSDEELLLVTGGTIVVTGIRGDDGEDDDEGDTGYDDDEEEDHDPEDDEDAGGDGADTEPADADVVEVRVFPGDTPLTPEQQQAVADLKQAIQTFDTWVNNLPDNAILRLSDGSTITGQEVKEAWANADFFVYPDGSDGTVSGRAEINWNDGDPEIYVDIGYLVERAEFGQAELTWLIGHEIGHVVDDQLDRIAELAVGGMTDAEWEEHQRMANDISRAIANFNGGDLSPNSYEYSDDNPEFEIPEPPSDDLDTGEGDGESGVDEPELDGPLAPVGGHLF